MFTSTQEVRGTVVLLFTSSIIPFSTYSCNVSVNCSHAGVYGVQHTWAVVQGFFDHDMPKVLGVVCSYYY